MWFEYSFKEQVNLKKKLDRVFKSRKVKFTVQSRFCLRIYISNFKYQIEIEFTLKTNQ